MLSSGVLGGLFVGGGWCGFGEEEVSEEDEEDSDEEEDICGVEDPRIDGGLSVGPGQIEWEVDAWKEEEHVADDGVDDAVVEVTEGTGEDAGEGDVCDPLVCAGFAEEDDDDDGGDACCDDEDPSSTLAEAEYCAGVVEESQGEDIWDQVFFLTGFDVGCGFEVEVAIGGEREARGVGVDIRGGRVTFECP